MSSELDDDAKLVRRIARGGAAVFAMVYDRHLPLVLCWSLPETQNHELTGLQHACERLNLSIFQHEIARTGPGGPIEHRD